MDPVVTGVDVDAKEGAVMEAEECADEAESLELSRPECCWRSPASSVMGPPKGCVVVEWV